MGHERPAASNIDAAVIPIVFDDRAMARLHAKGDDNALARAVFIGRSQTIYVSLPRAFEMVRRLRGVGTELHSQGAREIRAGTFLGRVVAHELGHILLTSQAHTTTGLMRPMFVFRDLASGDDTSIDLTQRDADRLAMRFSLVPRGPDASWRNASLDPAPWTSTPVASRECGGNGVEWRSIPTAMDGDVAREEMRARVEAIRHEVATYFDAAPPTFAAVREPIERALDRARKVLDTSSLREGFWLAFATQLIASAEAQFINMKALIAELDGPDATTPLR